MLNKYQNGMFLFYVGNWNLKWNSNPFSILKSWMSLQSSSMIYDDRVGVPD
jgi:hypothetical protein